MTIEIKNIKRRLCYVISSKDRLDIDDVAKEDIIQDRLSDLVKDGNSSVLMKLENSLDEDKDGFKAILSVLFSPYKNYKEPMMTVAYNGGSDKNTTFKYIEF